MLPYKENSLTGIPDSTNAESSPQEEEPQVFAVSRDLNHRFHFTRRNFLEAAAVTSAAVVVSGCKPVKQILASPQAPSATAAPSDTHTPAPTATVTQSPTATQTPSPTSTPFPTAVVKPATINVTFSPAFGSTLTGKLVKGDEVSILGRSKDNLWLCIQSPKGIYGWIPANYVTYNGNVKDLLEVTPEPTLTRTPTQTRTPTPTRTPTSTPLPGKKGKTSPGETGVDYTYKDAQGRVYSYTMPCGADIPEGAVCTCNCVTVPSCSCDGYVAPPACSCDSDSGGSLCTCDVVTYWYPN